ncbi:MAG: hypothetical protein A3F17_08485 [Gammaproteobacteria bacterium RIFCSPHIGHO2_12_FULL_41_15]|nr:MAG: hypothetical protein A3F17_08485 [Gammaproteobacteria bacterium RIFCSPHIGHO2_12_FULL_41_15]
MKKEELWHFLLTLDCENEKAMTQLHELLPDGELLASLTKKELMLLQSLINRFSRDTLTQLLNVLDSAGSILFQRLLENNCLEQIGLIIEKISPAALGEAICSQYKFSQLTTSILEALWGKLNREQFHALLNKVDSAALTKAATIKNSYTKNSFLQLTAKQSDAATFKLICDKINPATFDKLIYENCQQYTVFHYAVHNHDDGVLQYLRQKCNYAQLNRSLTTGFFRDSLLHILVKHKSREVIIAFTRKLSGNALETAFKYKNSFGDNVLHCLIKHQRNAETILAIIDTISLPCLEHLLLEKDQKDMTPFQQLARKNDKAALLGILSQVTQKTARQLLNFREDNIELTEWLQALIDTTQSEVELKQWLNILFKISRMTAINTLTLDNLPEVKEQLELHTFNPELPVVEKNLLITAYLTVERCLRSDRDAVTITFADNTILSIQDDGLTELLKRKGLKSWRDFWVLQQHCDSRPVTENQELRYLLTVMKTFNSLSLPRELSSQAEKIYEALAMGCLGIKMFTGWQKHAWQLFLDQLKDTTQRPALRKAIDPEKDTHKIDFTQKAVVERPARLAGAPPPFKEKYNTHAKKQAATILSPDGSTNFFQGNKTVPVNVGVLMYLDPDPSTESYDRDKAKVRVAFERDVGSFYRFWCGDKEKLERALPALSFFTSIAALQEAIRNHITKTNEALVEPSKGCILALVMTDDAPQTIKAARSYQNDLTEQLGLDVPLAYYDPQKKILIADYDFHKNYQQKLFEQLTISTDKLSKFIEQHKTAFYKFDSHVFLKLELLLWKKQEAGCQTITKAEVLTLLSKIDDYHHRIKKNHLFFPTRTPGLSDYPKHNDKNEFYHESDKIITHLMAAFNKQGVDIDPEAPSAACGSDDGDKTITSPHPHR